MESGREGLQRVVGVSGLSLTIVNVTIGAGIFALPAVVGIELGAFSVFAYVFCGIMMAAIMLCYAEVGTRVTSTGGSYAYIEAAFGDFAGFAVSWLAVFGWSVLGSAALMNIIADSLSVIFSSFSNPWIRGILFFFLLGFLALTNILGTKRGVAFIKWITIVKLLPLLGIIIFGFGLMNTENFALDHLPTLSTFGSTALVLFFAFAGFEISLGASGEIKDPNRTIPTGILLGGSIVLLIYLLLQTVTQGVLGSHMEGVKDAPLAAVAEQIVGARGATLLLMAAAISCFGSVSTDVLNSPRILYAGALDGLFPKFLGKLHSRFATPHWSIICYAGVVFLFSISGGFKQLAVLASAAILVIYLLVILSMIKMRLENKHDSEGIFKVPGGFLIPIFGIACISWLLMNLSKWEVLSAFIFLVAVSMIYLLTKWMKSRSILPFSTEIPK
ncbi:MAG: amino acid permease [Saprospiraceae bacterium]|nr:amino acid permease [Saprospiraceae bacterium]